MKGGNLKGLWIKLTATIMLVAATGVGIWATIDKLDDSTFRVAIGVVLTLVVVVVVGGLFIGKDLLQAYILRRIIQQDDDNDARQMAFTLGLLGRTRNPSVNVKVPEQQQPWSYLLPMGQQQQPGWIDGAYRDATMPESEVEIE